MTWRMPPETARQERLWMSFPRPNPTLGAGEDAEEARRAWSAVAHAALEFEPVTMLVDPGSRDDARRHLSADVAVLEVPLDEYWLRDSGPTFVLGDDGRLGAVDWVFNGWGANDDWTSWDAEQHVARAVAEAAGATVVPSPLVNEGGAIHVDGEGTVLVTRTVQLDPRRNPGADEAWVEAELARTLGAGHTVWLPRGLTRDYDRFGTRGHVDLLATIPSPGRVLLHDQRDPAHPDAAVSALLRQTFEQATDAAGRSWEIVPLPAPGTLRDGDGWVDWSYVNHVVVNGGVIACAFGEPQADAAAAAVLAEAYPGRRVVSVDARPVFARGGGLHCITQQQPLT